MDEGNITFLSWLRPTTFSGTPPPRLPANALEACPIHYHSAPPGICPRTLRTPPPYIYMIYAALATRLLQISPQSLAPQWIALKCILKWRPLPYIYMVKGRTQRPQLMRAPRAAMVTLTPGSGRSR